MGHFTKYQFADNIVYWRYTQFKFALSKITQLENVSLIMGHSCAHWSLYGVADDCCTYMK